MDWVFYSRNNQEMVDKFTRLGIIESSEVERAFRCVSRAAFVPDDLLEDAFKDTPLRGSHHVHLSAPHMYAAILEELDLDVGMSFLNVGSGTGYFSTLAGYIIKKDGINNGIELHNDLVKFANERISAFLDNGPLDSKEICTPVIISGNACRLDSDQIKYDRLYCGAACTQSNVKFLLKMVKVGGFLIAPVGSRLIKLKRVSAKEGRQSVINDVSFAPLVAASAEEMKLSKLRFPDLCNKKNRKNSVICDVSFPVSKNPGRKLLAKMRAYQDALDCLENETSLPMPFCYVPCFDDLYKAKSKQKRTKGKPTATTGAKSVAAITSSLDVDHAAVDSQIDFFRKASSSSLSMDSSKEPPLGESTRQLDSSSPVKRKETGVDWDFLSSNKTWLEVLEHYYSLCATTNARRNECTNIKVERPDSFSDQLKILTFKKYAKQMGLLSSKGRKKSMKGDAKTDSKGDAPVVEEVANDIVENLLEEVISQVDENDLAEDFLAAVTGTGPYSDGDIRRRSSVAKAIILDNLPRLRACAEEAGGLSPTLQSLIQNIDNEEKLNKNSQQSRDNSQDSSDEQGLSRESSLLEMQRFVDNVIADIDKQILRDIASDSASDSGGNLLVNDSSPLLMDADNSNTSSIDFSGEQQVLTKSVEKGEHATKGGVPEFDSEASGSSTADESQQLSHGELDAEKSVGTAITPSKDSLEAMDLQSDRDTIFVKKEKSGYFLPTDNITRAQIDPVRSDKDQLTSFISTDFTQKFDSSKFTLLDERRKFLHEKKGVSFAVGDKVPAGPEQWERDLPRSRPSPFRGLLSHDSSLLSDGDVSCSSLKNQCMDRVNERTPNSFQACIDDSQQLTKVFGEEFPNIVKGSLCGDSLEQVESFVDIGESCCTPAHPTLYPQRPSVNRRLMSTSNESFGSTKSHSDSYASKVDTSLGSTCDMSNFFEAVDLKEVSSAFGELRPPTCEEPSSEGHNDRYGKQQSSLADAAFGLSEIRKLVARQPGEVSIIGEYMDMSNFGTGKTSNSKLKPTASLLDLDVNSSLIASTPVHLPRTSSTAETKDAEGHKDTQKGFDLDVNFINSSEQVTKAGSATKATVSDKSCISKNYEPPLTTYYTASFKKKRKLRKAFMGIRMDGQSSKLLRSLPGKDWGLKHDMELVLYLSRRENMSGHVAFSNCCANVINPKCFSSTDLLQYKRIFSFPADALARRGIVLKRLAEVLDSVMNMLIGPSLMRDQFRTSYDSGFSLVSFTEASFESSGLPFQVGPDASSNPASENSKKKPDDCDTHEGVKHSNDDLMKSVHSMIQQEIEDVKRQKVIVLAKLKLYRNLTAEYDEQLRLLKEQVALVQEQQQLLQTRLRGRFPDGNSNQSVQQTEQMIQERKLHKKHLSEQLETIKSKLNETSSENECMLQIYKQLANLENRLSEERSRSKEMGWRYLAEESGNLKSFTQCVKKCNEVIGKLTSINGTPDSQSATEEAAAFDAVEEFDCSVKEAGARSVYRYHPHLLLAKSRFLFPLTSKRLGIIKELLRASETNSLHPCQVARIDRRVPLKERHKYPASNTVFMQAFNCLKNKDLNFRDAKRHFEKLWEVKFIGEGIIDQGGGFRDSLAEMADELCPASTEIKECLNFFIKAPNHKNAIGDYRDAYIPNPSCRDYHVYSWIGKLIGAAFRTDETLPLAFPPYIWKLLLGDAVTWAEDYIGVDETVVRVTDGLALLNEETFAALYGTEQAYTTHLSNGTEHDLIPNGSQIAVKPHDKSEYARLVRRARMMECEKQIKALRDGLVSVVPEALLSCLTWQDFERGVCGTAEITVNDLKANCRYEVDLSPTVDCVRFLWEALASFTSEERSKFIRFVTGRRRLPSPFFISRCSSDEQHLPSASTCGSNLYLPYYTDAKTAAEKIRYAINNCVSIDTDTSPW